MSGLLPDGCKTVNDAMAWAVGVRFEMAGYVSDQHPGGDLYRAWARQLLTHLRRRTAKLAVRKFLDDTSTMKDVAASGFWKVPKPELPSL